MITRLLFFFFCSSILASSVSLPLYTGRFWIRLLISLFSVSFSYRCSSPSSLWLGAITSLICYWTSFLSWIELLMEPGYKPLLFIKLAWSSLLSWPRRSLYKFYSWWSLFDCRPKAWMSIGFSSVAIRSASVSNFARCSSNVICFWSNWILRSAYFD